MWDVCKRVLVAPHDYAGGLRRQTLTLEDSTDEGAGIHTFTFALEEATKWRAGQHAIFRFPQASMKGRNWRPFSIAASPHEQLVRVGTKIPETPSDFKTKLRSLCPGDPLTMHGPFGEFYVGKQDTHIIGLAAGIGSTPFRALLYEVAHGYSHVPITLIYSARPDEHTYHEVFTEYENMNELIDIRYVSGKDETTALLETLINEHGNDASYFISGSPAVIEATQQTLKQHRIKRIVNDPFKGY